ncbi:hypothetical protein Bca4012_073171 [Brassica carinata]
MAVLTNPSILKIIIWSCHSYHYNIILCNKYQILHFSDLLRSIKTLNYPYHRWDLGVCKVIVSLLGLGGMQSYPK